MSEYVSSSVIAEQKEDMPAESGVWAFVLGDMMIFAAFFALFLIARGNDPEAFAQSQTALNQTYGAINTLLLLTSSLFVALGLKSYREALFTPKKQVDALAEFSKMMLLAIVCGVGFLLLKSFEYQEKFSEGITLVSNDFFMYYFVFTGLHLVHVLIGLAILIYIRFQYRSSAVLKEKVNTVEGGALYWHMVDLLWVVLFPLFYLL